MKSKFRFVHVPGLVPTENVVLNLSTNVLYDTRISDHADAIVWKAVTDAYVINQLDSSDVALATLERLVAGAVSTWHHGEHTKEFKYVLSKYATSDSVLGSIQPGSWISLEWENKHINVICTGFRLIFKQGDKTQAITRYGLEIKSKDVLEQMFIAEIAAAEEAVETKLTPA